MMVTYSEGLSEQLQLKLRNRSLRKSGNGDKSEITVLSFPAVNIYISAVNIYISAVSVVLDLLKTQGVWRVLDYKL